MKIVETKVFTFDELSEEGKERAIENHRSKDYPLVWQEENRDTLEKFAEIFPIKITDWCYGRRGEGVYFSFTANHDAIEEFTGWRLAKYIWNNYKRDLFKGRWYSKCWNPKTNTLSPKPGVHSPDRYSKIMIEGRGRCVLTGYCMDEEILEPIYNFLDKPNNQTFKELLEDCFEEWVKACNSDVEYQQSDEYLSDELANNDYEFTEDGEVF